MAVTKEMAVETIAQQMQVALVKVEPHVGYPNLEFQFPKELEIMRGSNGKLANLVKEFTQASLNAGSLSMFPNEIKTLRSIGNSLRTFCIKYYITDKYVNAIFVKEIRAAQEDITLKFEAQVKDILGKWATEEKQFRQNLKHWLEAIRMPQEKRKKFFAIMADQIPSKDEFAARCYIGVDYTPIQAPTEKIPTFSDDVNGLLQESYKNQMLTLGKGLVNKCISDAYNTANNTLRTCLNGREPNQKSRNAIANLGTVLELNNLFSNELIASIAKAYKRIIAMDMHGEDLEDSLANILLSIWQYKNQGGIVDMKGCIMTDNELASLEAMQKAQLKLDI